MSTHATRIAVTALTFAGFCSALVGCSSPEATRSLAPTVAGPAGTHQLDACTLIAESDVQHLLGKAVLGKPNNNEYVSECEWKDDETQNSLTLHIGNAGTAAGNKLPDHSDIGMPASMLGKPGPDGMLLEGNGVVTFPAGNRKNFVQIAVLPMIQAGTAEAAGIDLARKVAPQIPN